MGGRDAANTLVITSEQAKNAVDATISTAPRSWDWAAFPCGFTIVEVAGFVASAAVSWAIGLAIIKFSKLTFTPREEGKGEVITFQ